MINSTTLHYIVLPIHSEPYYAGSKISYEMKERSELIQMFVESTAFDMIKNNELRIDKLYVENNPKWKIINDLVKEHFYIYQSSENKYPNYPTIHVPSFIAHRKGAEIIYNYLGNLVLEIPQNVWESHNLNKYMFPKK